MAAYHRVDDLRSVTCGLTAYTPGSAPGQRSVSSMEKPFPLPFLLSSKVSVTDQGQGHRRKTSCWGLWPEWPTVAEKQT